MRGENKSRYEKKTNTFYFIRSFLKQRPVTTTTTMRSKVFASLAKRGEKRALLFARTWKRQNARRSAMASRRSKTVVKNAMNFPQNVSNFFTPLLAFTKANELEKRSERAYLEYPVCVVVFISRAPFIVL